MVEDAGSETVKGGRWSGILDATLTSAGVGSLAGVLAGFVWGGIGGRIAMRVLFLTSPDFVNDLISDDGFEIGIISAATIFLLIFTSIVGGLGGFLYGLIRMVLGGPRWTIAIGVAIAAAAAVGGGLIVNPEGIDFRLLEPLGLAVALFLVIPAAWGVTVVLLTDRLLRPGTVFSKLPAQINKRYWGATGWLILVAMTVLGITDLVRDVAKLT